MQNENLFMSVVSRNKHLYKTLCNVKQYYLNEKIKICNEVRKFKDKCKIEWKLYIEKNNLSIKFGFDLIILDLKIKELDLRIRNVKNSMHLTCKLLLVGTFRFKKISNKKKIILKKETCSICCETHKITKLLTTNCGHHFGECCFGKYVEHKLESNTAIKCPLCRSNNILPVIKYN